MIQRFVSEQKRVLEISVGLVCVNELELLVVPAAEEFEKKSLCFFLGHGLPRFEHCRRLRKLFLKLDGCGIFGLHSFGHLLVVVALYLPRCDRYELFNVFLHLGLRHSGSHFIDDDLPFGESRKRYGKNNGNQNGYRKNCRQNSFFHLFPPSVLLKNFCTFVTPLMRRAAKISVSGFTHTTIIIQKH